MGNIWQLLRKRRLYVLLKHIMNKEITMAISASKLPLIKFKKISCLSHMLFFDDNQCSPSLLIFFYEIFGVETNLFLTSLSE